MLKRLVAVSGIVLLPACDTAPSDVVGTFLEAVRTGNLATLARVSMVGWPRDKGPASDIEAWWITRVASSQIEPFHLEEWQRRLNAARARRDASLERGEGGDVDLQRIESRVERFRIQVEGERETARKSVETWAPIDGFQGEVEIRQVEVIVRLPNGDQRYALTLKRYRLSRPPETDPIPSRWIVTAIESAEG